MARTSEVAALSVLQHHVLQAAEQMVAFGETHATMLSAAVLVLLTSLLIACACRECCRRAAVHEYIYTRLLHQEDEQRQETLLWERLSIVKELLLQLADIVTDITWSASMLSKGHIMFSLMNVLIIVVASVARFTMERLAWKKADEDIDKHVRQQDEYGRRKPGLVRLFTHLLQLNPVVDGWHLWRGTAMPAWNENLVIEGACEGIPSFLLQVYATLLLHELETMTTWELAKQLISNALSLRAASVAMSRLNVGLATDLPLGPLLFRAADVASRLLMIVLAALVMRPPGARLHEAHQSAFFIAVLISTGSTVITVHVVNQKLPMNILFKSVLCCVFGSPYLSVPEGSYLYQQRRLRHRIVLLHNLEATLVNTAIGLQWGRGKLYGDAMVFVHLSHVSLWLGTSLVLLADELSLRCFATALLPTGREWQTLEWASALGMATMVKKRVSAEQGIQWSLCKIATEEGQVSVLRIFEGQLSAMRSDKGGTLVHIAADANQVPILGYLQMPEVGADIFSAKTNDGYTAAMVACAKGHADVVKFLHANMGADIFSAKTNDGCTAAILACNNGHADVVKLLHAKMGAEVFTAKADNGYTAAIVACAGGHADVVKLLHANMGAEVFSAKTDKGNTAALLACQNGHADIAKLLYANMGAEVFTAKADNGATAAWLACQNGHADVAKWLHAKMGAEVFSAKTNDGYTAALMACANGHADVVKLLHAKMGAEVFTAKNNYGYTAAMLACANGHADVVKFLHAKMGAEVFSAKADDGYTAAMLAAQANQDEVVAYLERHNLG